MWTAGTWRAIVELPDHLVDPIREAAADLLPPAEYQFLVEMVDGREQPCLAFAFDVSNDDDHEAVAAARWRTFMKRAGLDPVEPLPTRFEWPSYDDTRYDALRREADELLAAQQYDLAVLRAQSSCEALAHEALAGGLRAELGREAGNEAAAQLRASLNHKGTRERLKEITGHEPAQEPWWEEYRAHLNRRNMIAHGGLSVGRADAERSLVAVDACRQWLRDFWRGALG